MQQKVKKDTTKSILKVEIPRENLAPQDDLIFSLDIGTRTVVGVVGEANSDNDELILRDYHVEEHTKRAMIDGQIEDIKQVAKIVAKVKHELEQKTGVAFTKVCIAAAGRALKTKQLSMDFEISDKDAITEDMIKTMEIEVIQKAQGELDEEYKDQSLMFYCVGYSVIRYSIDDYKIVNLEGHKGNTASIEMIATFLPNAVVEGLYSVMDMCGLEVDSLTLEPIAAMNVIVPPEIRLINIALVDIGAGTSDIAISRDGSIIAYAMATTAGDEITEEIIKAYFVDFATAESMKHLSTSGAAEFNYRDIFGITQTVKTADFTKKIESAVELLAETICENIVQVNTSSPAAVFLVGGGSLITGLASRVAKKLNLDENRVAIGSTDNFRTVDTLGKQLGAEFVTPVGIGVTGILNRGYDFSVIMLNDEKIRVFDTKNITIYDLLTLGGYKSQDIMGRSGRPLTFTIDGQHKTVKGGSFVPAQVFVNGEASSLTAKVTQGDRVSFVPAQVGEDGHIKLSEIEGLFFDKGYAIFGDTRYEFGAEYFVGKKEVNADYDIQPLDIITRGGITTLGDLIEYMGIENSGLLYTVDGNEVDMNYMLSDGDIIEYLGELETGSRGIPLKPEPEIHNDTPEELWGEIKINLNGNDVILPPTESKLPHAFLELLNYVELDTSNPVGNYVMLLNDRDTGFNEQIKNGDIAVIKWA